MRWVPPAVKLLKRPRLAPALFRPFSRMATQRFDYFLVLDFEATCDTAERKVVNEIIEFPVLLVDDTFREIDCFHQFVKPRIKPTLTPFCMQLTGIDQQTVDAAQHLPQVWKDFRSWLKKHCLIGQREGEAETSIARFAFVTCGCWDLAVALPDDLSRYQLQQPAFARSWIDVKAAFHCVTGQWPRGLHQMLSVMKLEAGGRAHSGIDDCRNTLLLMKALAAEGHVFSITDQS